jgi:hypothetical protein
MNGTELIRLQEPSSGRTAAVGETELPFGVALLFWAWRACSLL